MAVEIESLFGIALRLAAPWRVASIEFNTVQQRVDFKLTCAAKYLPCSLGHKAGQSIHGRLERQWRHLDYFQCEAWLHAKLPRLDCDACGKTIQIEVPWPREGSGFTLFFVSLALSLCQDLPVRQAAQQLRCNDKQLWRRVGHYVGVTRQLDDMFGVKLLALTRTACAKVRTASRRCTRTTQRCQVFGQHLGGDINNQSLLTQTRGGLQMHRTLEPLVLHFGSPALVIKLAKALPREIHRGQVRCQDTPPCFGRQVANQSHFRGGGCTSPVLHILSHGCVQSNEVSQKS